jgi:hypothetical protein
MPHRPRDFWHTLNPLRAASEGHGIMLALSPRMRRTTSRAGTMALALCVSAAATTISGCSLLFVDAPPENAKKLKMFTCTQSNTLPVVDGVIAGLSAIDIATALVDGTSTYDANGNLVKKPDYGLAIGAGAVAALFATSAYIGNSRATACKEATAELMSRLFPGPGFGAPAPAPYAPPPQPYDPWTAPPPGAAPAPSPPAAPAAEPWGAPPAGGAAPPAAPPPSAPPAPGAAPPAPAPFEPPSPPPPPGARR